MYYLIDKHGETIDKAETLKDIEDLREMQEYKDKRNDSWTLEKYTIIQK